MKLLVFSHKVCWNSAQSSIGYATDGGFVFHMQSLASTYEKVYLLVPIDNSKSSDGEILFTDECVEIIPLSLPFGKGIGRKILFPIWFFYHLPKFIYYILKSDIVHAPIPGDIGTIGLILAPLFRKKLFVRYCGDWYTLKTLAEKFWGWYGDFLTGKSIAFFATGGGEGPPSSKNKNIKWIFSSSMLNKEIKGYQQRGFDFRNQFQIAIGGRLIKEKGFGVLIEAISLIKGDIPNILVKIYGDGPDLVIFRTKANDLGISENILFLGKLNANQVHVVLSEVDLFCFPTYSSEGFPKALIEAMAHGLPIISTNVSVIPSLINNANQRAGFIIAKQSPIELAEKIKFYYENPNLHKIHADNSKAVSQKYTLENWVDNINNDLNNQWHLNLCRNKEIKK